MKKTPPLFLLFLLPYFSNAQVRIDTSILNTNLFESFVNGSVRLKNGNIEQALLNYDTQNQSIVFKKQGQVLVLTNLSEVDTVYIENRKFIPVEKNTFYEILIGSVQVALYVAYSNKKKPVVATVEHSGAIRKANTDVSNTVSGAYLSRPFNANYTLEITRHYWLRRGHSFYKANNEKQLVKVFPFKDHEKIKAYIKENNITFSETDHIIKLINYCNSLLE